MLDQENDKVDFFHKQWKNRKYLDLLMISPTFRRVYLRHIYCESTNTTTTMNLILLRRNGKE